jgi:hypothetical protein
MRYREQGRIPFVTALGSQEEGLRPGADSLHTIYITAGNITISNTVTRQANISRDVVEKAG